MKLFSSEVCEALAYYVYRLIDPRNGETFYVGKGKNNRVFEHLKQSLKITTDDEDEITLKYSRIRAIHKAGLDVIHIIHRHNMDEKTAFEVEAALIDAYPSLSNEQNGHGNNEFGSMHITGIYEKYEAAVAEFSSEHNLLIININRSFDKEKSAYEAIHLAWRLDVKRAKCAHYILAVEKGLIVDVLQADEWLEATKENFPELLEDRIGRFGFHGKALENDHAVKKQYLRKRLPEEYRKRGASNPVKYSFK